MDAPDQPAFTLSPAQQRLYDATFNSGFTRWSGVRLVETRPGFARFGLSPRVEMLTPWGTLNGSVLNCLVEIAALYALLTELGPDELPGTNDIVPRHVRPLPGDAECQLTGQALRRRRSLAWLEATVFVGGKPRTFARLTKTLVQR